MTQEQGPQEISKRNFSPLEAQILTWMVLNHDENNLANANRQLAGELNIDIHEVEGALKGFEKRTGLQMTEAINLAIKTAVLNNELIVAEEIFDMPEPSLDKKEQLLREQFSNCYSNSQICTNLNLRNEEFRNLKGKLFRKFGTKNRYFITAYDTAQRLKGKK